MNINDTLKYMRVGLPEDILRRKLHGDFDGAIRLIDRRLARELVCRSVQRAMEEGRVLTQEEMEALSTS